VLRRTVCRLSRSVICCSYIEIQVALLQDPTNVEARTKIVAFPNFGEAHKFMQSHHLGIADSEIMPIGSVGPTDSSDAPRLRVNGFQVIGSNRCLGYLDAVTPELGWKNRVVAVGWAWNLDSVGRPLRVILVLEDGTVVGSGEVSLKRPDVQRGVSQVTDLNSGWMAEGYVPRGSLLRAFVVSDNSTMVCPLSNEFRRP
jgi:hypothetical protein